MSRRRVPTRTRLAIAVATLVAAAVLGTVFAGDEQPARLDAPAPAGS